MFVRKDLKKKMPENGSSHDQILAMAFSKIAR